MKSMSLAFKQLSFVLPIHLQEKDLPQPPKAMASLPWRRVWMTWG
jgi:hypothetical protein